MKHTIELNGTEITFEATENDAENVKHIATNLIGMKGFVNLDASDVVDVLDGAKIISVGEGNTSGDDKVRAATLEAIKNASGISGAKSILAEVVSGADTFLSELSDVAFTIEGSCKEDVNVVWGHVLDGAMDDSVRVDIITVA